VGKIIQPVWDVCSTGKKKDRKTSPSLAFSLDKSIHRRDLEIQPKRGMRGKTVGSSEEEKK